MAVTGSIVTAPNWQGMEDAARNAYDRAIRRYNLQKDQLQAGSGIKGLGNIQDYLNKDAAGPNFDIDQYNQFGGYQMMKYRQGNQLQGINDAFDTEFSTTGYQGEQERQARFGHEAEYSDWRNNILNSVTGMITGASEANMDLGTAIGDIGYQRAAWDAEHKLDDPVAATQPNSPAQGAAASPQEAASQQRQAEDWAKSIQIANQRGDTATLAALFKDKRLPETLRKLADQYYKTWAAKRYAERTKNGIVSQGGNYSLQMPAPDRAPGR